MKVFLIQKSRTSNNYVQLCTQCLVRNPFAEISANMEAISLCILQKIMNFITICLFFEKDLCIIKQIGMSVPSLSKTRVTLLIK